MARASDLDEHAHLAAQRLRRMIVCQLALASPLLVLAAGCSATPPATDDGGVTTNQGSNGESPESGEAPESGASSDGAESSDDEVTSEDSTDTSATEETETTEASESGSESESESEGGFKLDLAPSDDTPPESSCWGFYLTEADAIAAYPDCGIIPFDPNIPVDYVQLCVDRPPDGDCADICPPDMLCEGMAECFVDGWFGMCGPYETDDSCCLLLAAQVQVIPGRPFVVDGSTRLAEVADAPVSRIATHWLEVARGEHASIAAFARFVAILQRCGAPARLLADAIAAAADEAGHAEQTLALASRFAGRELELGALAIDGALRDTEDLAAAVRAAVREGCIDETLSAHEAACLAAHAEDPQVVRVLERIASDEARHAALAWKFVAWVLERRPDLRGVVAEAFANVAVPQRCDSHESDALALGCPSPGLRARWRRVGLRELVGPCAAGLLDQTRRTELSV
jgi:hypothetical protein